MVLAGRFCHFASVCLQSQCRLATLLEPQPSPVPRYKSGCTSRGVRNATRPSAGGHIYLQNHQSCTVLAAPATSWGGGFPHFWSASVRPPQVQLKDVQTTAALAGFGTVQAVSDWRTAHLLSERSSAVAMISAFSVRHGLHLVAVLAEGYPGSYARGHTSWWRDVAQCWQLVSGSGSDVSLIVRVVSFSCVSAFGVWLLFNHTRAQVGSVPTQDPLLVSHNL